MSKDLLLQNELIKYCQSELGRGTWITVYSSEDGPGFHRAQYSGLIVPDKLSIAMERPDWDIKMGDGGPTFISEWVEDHEVTEYVSKYSWLGVEPVAIYRDFHGISDNYIEISEEFRLFHNICFEERSSKYYCFNDAGDKFEVIRFTNNRVEVLSRVLRSYMAARQMHLLLYFDYRQFSSDKVSYEKLDDYKLEIQEEHLRLERHAGTMLRDEPFSRVVGKKLVRCGAMETCGVSPFHSTPNYESFIIGENNDGEPIVHSCNPDILDNNFDANPGAPHYLTPVYFRKEVLSKYYGDPSKYAVEDGYVQCAALWSCHVDNDHSDYVSVFLGDLGRDLPESEQKYWRSFNIVLEGGVSPTCYRRSFLGQFADPESPDLIFQQNYRLLTQKWEEQFGWCLYRQLHKDDEHYFDTLHIPLSDNQLEFDAQVLSLAKILVDSLNSKRLSKELKGEYADEPGISLLSHYLEAMGLPDFQTHISFLRQLYGLRSTGVGHKKGSKFEVTMKKVGIDSKPLNEGISIIFTRANYYLKSLADYFLNGL